MNKPRWATTDDNQALLELARACPMSGAVTLYFDRSPDYFVLSRLQGAGGHVCVVDAQEGGLAAVATIATFPQVFVHGKVRQVMYACDLKVHPKQRSGHLVKRIYSQLHNWAVNDCGCDLAFTTVMQGNRAMRSIVQGRAGITPAYRYIGTLRNYTVQYLFSKKLPKDIEVRRATYVDLPDMVAFWNRIQASREFAPYWTVESLKKFIENAPGLEISHYYLAYRNEKLVGMLATWDQQTFKQMIVLNYAEHMRRMKLWYNPLASLLGLARMPESGQTMPYFYATQIAAETPHDLQALYATVYNENKNRKYLFFSTMLDVRDPLNLALEGFLTKSVDIELYAMELVEPWQENQSLIYFDPAIV